MGRRQRGWPVDFLWIDKFTGNTHVWYNMRPRQISGSSWWWETKGQLYAGSSSGPNLHFPNLGGAGRADMTEVNPQSELGWTWFNSCPTGGDDGSLVLGCRMTSGTKLRHAKVKLRILARCVRLDAPFSDKTSDKANVSFALVSHESGWKRFPGFYNRRRYGWRAAKSRHAVTAREGITPSAKQTVGN